MDARNRMADVVMLRCNACQDFFRMIIRDGWQQVLYEKAKQEVEVEEKYYSKYIAVYRKIREVGIDNFSIDEMDVTLISAIVHDRELNNIAPTKKETRICIEHLTEDRNEKDHSGENESAEKKYLLGLLALCNLREFIRTVDRYETEIDDEKRIAYLQEYSKKIDDLMSTLDEERITLIQQRKVIEKDVQSLLNCNTDKERLDLWVPLVKELFDRGTREKNYDSYNQFCICASDAGIPEAHLCAIDYLLTKKDYAEVERRLFMILNSYDTLPNHESKSIVDIINHCLMKKVPLSEGMKSLISILQGQGYPIETTESGLYFWKKKTE